VQKIYLSRFAEGLGHTSCGSAPSGHLRPRGFSLAREFPKLRGDPLTDDHRRRRLRHESTTGDSEPADRQHGDWSRERLERMDEKFRAAVERAIANGEEQPSMHRSAEAVHGPDRLL
jgi:hypothetical protein